MKMFFIGISGKKMMKKTNSVSKMHRFDNYYRIVQTFVKSFNLSRSLERKHLMLDYA